jgi:TonB family protein
MRSMVVVLLATVVVSCGTKRSQGPVSVIQLPDPAARRQAVLIVAPKYPAESLSQGAHGVAVGAVRIAGTGAIKSVALLQAPDRGIGDAMLAALRGWRFKPIASASGRPVDAVATVVYYFEIKDGTPEIMAPSNAPIIGQVIPIR